MLSVGSTEDVTKCLRSPRRAGRCGQAGDGGVEDELVPGELLEGRGPPRTLSGARYPGCDGLRKLVGGDRLDTSRGAGVPGWHRRRLTESERGTSSSSAADRMLPSTLVAVTQSAAPSVTRRTLPAGPCTGLEGPLLSWSGPV